MFASEYGWSIDQIDDIRIDVETELAHAILYRKGAKVYLTNLPKDRPEINLLDVIKEKNEMSFDTSAIEEGITWLALQ